MRTFQVGALFLFLCVISTTVSANRFPQARQTSLYHVQKLYIEDMGTQAEASRFRILLEEKLLEKDFIVVDKPENADAILSGALSVTPVGLYGGTTDVGVTVQLKSSSGERLWNGNFAGRIIILNPVTSLKFKDIVEYRAKELAKKLRSDWEKSAIVAGVKVGR